MAQLGELIGGGEPGGPAPMMTTRGEAPGPTWTRSLRFPSRAEHSLTLGARATYRRGSLRLPPWRSRPRLRRNPLVTSPPHAHPGCRRGPRRRVRASVRRSDNRTPLVGGRWPSCGGGRGRGATWWQRSPLWLDEATSVNIARLPLGEHVRGAATRRSPPFYYLLLHGWMEVFGESDFAVRAAVGDLSPCRAALAWIAGRRLARGPRPAGRWWSWRCRRTRSRYATRSPHTLHASDAPGVGGLPGALRCGRSHVPGRLAPWR